MKKRVLSLFMALALCFSMLPTAALAEEAGAAPDAANANSTYTNGEDAGLAGGEDDSVPDDTDGGDIDSSGEVQAAETGTHTAHCVCGKDSTTVNGHTHSTNTEWKATDSLPNSAGSYYLTQSVSGGWTVPEGKVNLCLKGQTINGSITVGSGATLTLTNCSGSGSVQGEVTVNGGTFELYGGTITGGVQVGMKGGDYKTGSAFTMYGGTISGHNASSGSGSGGGVFLVGTTNHEDPPSFTMHGGTISDNTAGASDGGGGGVYVGEKCSFTMDGGTITGNTATAGNGGGIYIYFNAGNVSISNATITGNKASATGNTSYGHGGGIYSERGVTVKNVTITGNNSTFEGGGIYGKGAITLTDATVTDNSQYDVYYDGKETTTPELTVSGSVKAGYYANYAWKLPILVSGALREDSVIRVGVREGINLGAIAEPASGVTLSAENFEADAVDCVTSLGEDGKVYLVPCTHEMDDTGYTCKKCHTQFDARIGESAYYKTLTEAFNAVGDSTVTLLRDVTLTGNCSATDFKTLDLNGKTVSTKNKYIGVGGGNKPNTLTVKDSGTGGGTQALDVTFYVSSNGTLAVGDSYTGEISRVELQAGGALERFGGKIGELALSNAAGGSTSTGYNLKLWNGNTNACTIGGFTDNTTSKSLTVKDLLKTNHAKCELYGEKGGTWSIVPKTEKISELTGYTAYKVQFPECVHQCADDSNPVCSVCHKDLYTKITAKAADGTTKTAYFTADSALEHGYVEAIQTLNGWSAAGCTEPTLTLLRNMDVYNTSMPLTGTLTLKGGTHTAKNVTVAENADVTFASGIYEGATINGTATVKEGVTFTTASVEVNGTLNVEGGTFNGPVEFKGSSIANISGGNFTNDKSYEGVEFDYSVTGTISGGTFAFAWFYTTKVKLSGGTFTTIKTSGDRKLADLLAEGAAYYSGDSAVSDDKLSSLTNVTVKSHKHNGGTDGKGICSICGKQMTASLTVGGTTSWYTAFATAIEAANAADGEKTITLYQNVNDTVDGKRTTYELTRGPVTLATGGKRVDGVDLTAKGISLTVTGSDGGFYVTVDGKDAELTVNDKDTKLAIVTAQNGGKLSLSNGAFSRVAVKDDGSSASLSGGSYGAITSDPGYVKPYALLAKGYAYKKTKDNQWLPNANSIPSEVTVEKAPYAVEKIYPNSDTNYTGNSAFATDGSITLTAVIASETQGVTYTYWWELFNESTKDWTTHFGDVNTATHDGKQSKTLSISNLPENSSYQYHVYVSSNNGYNCYSEPFTVTRHQHSWTYTASGATITASCTDTTCTSPNGGSVTIAAPAGLTYSGEGKPATVTASSDWQGPAVSAISIGYIKMGTYGQEKLENSALPTNAGTYTASIKLGEATASVEYTIDKAALTVTPKGGQSKKFGATDPTLTYTTSGAVGSQIPSFTGKLSRAEGEDVGQYDITLGTLAMMDYNSSGFKASNYTLKMVSPAVKFEITKGTYGGSAPTKTVNILKNYAGVQTGTLTAADFFTTAPAEAKITNAVPNAASSNMMSIAGADSSGNFTYDSKTNITAASDESWTVTISSKNYTDINATLTFELVDKTDVSAQITFPNGTLTYNGAGQKYEKATTSGVSGGTWNYTYVANSGTGASLDSAGLPKTAGTYTVTAKYEDDAHIGTKPATLTVSKATPTGAPTCTKITTSGKTLADAPLAIGTIAPAGGTLAWDMAANTVVAANTAYGWTYTPADTANYKALTGSLTPYAVSSGGGGGGGGSYTPSYTVSVDKTVNGTITVSPKSASKGYTVTITVKPDKGYELDTLKVLDKNGDKVKLTEKNGKYTFTMPAGKVTVKGSFVEEAPEQIFTDVPVDAYFYEAVKWAAEKGITGGVGNGLFAPNQPCTRAQIVTFLWRAAGSPGPKTMSDFSDVPADSYYAKAVAWAVENGITGGTGDGKFSPDATCTRAQAVTFLYRASGAPAVSGNAAFSDVATNAYYAAAVKWAEKNGITGGIGGGLFGSDNNCTRAQIVTFLYRNYQSK